MVKTFLVRNKTGRFENPGVEYLNQTLYASAVIGLPDAEGFPKLDDPCTVWTPNGARVVFYEPVNINIVQENCEGNSYYVELTIQGGLGELSPTYAYRTVSDGTTTFQNVSKDELITFGPYSGNGMYTIEVEDDNQCTAIYTNLYTCGAQIQVQSLNFSDVHIFTLDQLNLEADLQAVSIFNTNGQTVETDVQIYGRQFMVKFTKPVKGLYLAQLKFSNGAMQFVKIVKQ